VLDLGGGGGHESVSGRRRVMIGYGFPALVELLTAKLKVVPLSSRRLPPVRLSVELPPADALLD